MRAEGKGDVTHKVVELSQTHLRSNVLSHSDHGDSEDGQTLVRHVVLLFVKVVVAVVKHRLDLEDISSPSIGADVGEDNGLLRDGVGDSLEDLDGRFRRVLST